MEPFHPPWINPLPWIHPPPVTSHPGWIHPGCACAARFWDFGGCTGPILHLISIHTRFGDFGRCIGPVLHPDIGTSPVGLYGLAPCLRAYTGWYLTCRLVWAGTLPAGLYRLVLRLLIFTTWMDPANPKNAGFIHLTFLFTGWMHPCRWKVPPSLHFLQGGIIHVMPRACVRGTPVSGPPAPVSGSS
ncbi:hypothetical protein C8R43DRAFT_941226 [Mycena crocata]|nr:hypothetical protein C8R43DRAFT_941226 [Mycena crocata]